MVPALHGRSADTGPAALRRRDPRTAQAAACPSPPATLLCCGGGRVFGAEGLLGLWGRTFQPSANRRDGGAASERGQRSQGSWAVLLSAKRPGHKQWSPDEAPAGAEASGSRGTTMVRGQLSFCHRMIEKVSTRCGLRLPGVAPSPHRSRRPRCPLPGYTLHSFSGKFSVMR